MTWIFPHRASPCAICNSMPCRCYDWNPPTRQSPLPMPVFVQDPRVVDLERRVAELEKRLPKPRRQGKSRRPSPKEKDE